MLPMDANFWGVSVASILGSRFICEFFMAPWYTVKDSYFYTLASPLIRLYWWVIQRKLKNGIPDELIPSSEYRNEIHYIGGARNTDVYDKMCSGEIKFRKGTVSRFAENGVFCNEELVEADLVVCATGFGRELFGLENSTDLWMYRNALLPGVKNFAIMGLINTYCNPMYTNLQAVWLNDVLRGRVKLPSNGMMKDDIDKRKKHTKTVVLDAGVASFSWFTYPLIDQFLSDMGLEVNRKENRLKYWFETVLPSDYKTVVTHRV